MDIGTVNRNLNGVKVKLDAFNIRFTAENKKTVDVFEKDKAQYLQNIFTSDGILTDLKELLNQKCLSRGAYLNLSRGTKAWFKNSDVVCGKLHQLVEFDDDDELVTEPNDWNGEEAVRELLKNYVEFKNQYKQLIQT